MRPSVPKYNLVHVPIHPLNKGMGTNDDDAGVNFIILSTIVHSKTAAVDIFMRIQVGI